MQKLDWCQQKGINRNAFYYWQRKIRNHIFEIQEKSDSTQLTTTGQDQNKSPVTTLQKSDLVRPYRKQFRPIKNGDIFEIGNMALEILECPGHTKVGFFIVFIHFYTNSVCEVDEENSLCYRIITLPRYCIDKEI